MEPEYTSLRTEREDWTRYCNIGAVRLEKFCLHNQDIIITPRTHAAKKFIIQQISL